MKFTAKKIDLDLELTTIAGEILAVKGPAFSGREAGGCANRLNNGGLEFDRLDPELRTPMAAATMFSDQLSSIYVDVAPEWWAENLDLSTIKEIRNHVIATLLGVEKKGPSSVK